MGQITTHILDTSTGIPAVGVAVRLFRATDDGWEMLASGITDDDGRVDPLSPGQTLAAGNLKLHFDIGPYFADNGRPCFYPYAEIAFTIQGDGQHYHVPLLLNPFGYSTYRGS